MDIWKIKSFSSLFNFESSENSNIKYYIKKLVTWLCSHYIVKIVIQWFILSNEKIKILIYDVIFIRNNNFLNISLHFKFFSLIYNLLSFVITIGLREQSNNIAGLNNSSNNSRQLICTEIIHKSLNRIKIMKKSLCLDY